MGKNGLIPEENFNSIHCFSFCASLVGFENDMRFVYCATCICYILKDWSYINIPNMVQFIMKSLVSKNTYLIYSQG